MVSKCTENTSFSIELFGYASMWWRSWSYSFLCSPDTSFYLYLPILSYKQHYCSKYEIPYWRIQFSSHGRIGFNKFTHSKKCLLVKEAYFIICIWPPNFYVYILSFCSVLNIINNVNTYAAEIAMFNGCIVVYRFCSGLAFLCHY